MKRTTLRRRDFWKTGMAGTTVALSPSFDGRPVGTTCPAVSRLAGAASEGETREGTVVRSDMAQCKPAKNLTRHFENDRWQLIDYETTNGVKGVMASARPDHTCGELTLSLDVKGMYRLYLGIHLTKSHYPGDSPYGQLEVKLSRDAGFRRVGPEHDTVDEDGSNKFGGEGPDINRVITEAYWKTADLTGQALSFRQPQYPYNRPEHANISNLSYVKLEPLTDREKEEWQENQPREETRKLALISCTGQYTGHTHGTYSFHPTSRLWFQDEFEPFLHSDIKIFIFEALRGNFCLYRTGIGEVGTPDNRWQRDWLDPLAEFTKRAHDNGMKIFAGMRFIGPQYPMNVAPIAWARHYWKHPEWTRRNQEGVPLAGWSLAYPEVRRYWLSLLREALDYGIDGIQLHLNRSEPYVFFEEPVVESFRAKYDQDPRRLSIRDPRWVAHSAGYVTRFVREVRELVDEKPGRELGVTVSGRKNGQEAHYQENHCDVEVWLRERLVNYLMPTPYLHTALLQKWRKMGGNGIQIWPDLMPRAQSAAAYARLAKKYYEAGADGLCLWDGERRTARISEWAAVQRLGHIRMLDRLMEQAPSYYRASALKYLGGFDVRWSFKDG